MTGGFCRWSGVERQIPSSRRRPCIATHAARARWLRRWRQRTYSAVDQRWNWHIQQARKFDQNQPPWTRSVTPRQSLRSHRKQHGVSRETACSQMAAVSRETCGPPSNCEPEPLLFIIVSCVSFYALMFRHSGYPVAAHLYNLRPRARESGWAIGGEACLRGKEVQGREAQHASAEWRRARS